MSWKGHTFTREDAPVGIRRSSDKLEAWMAEQTARYAIVFDCPCGEPVIREEIQGHVLGHARNGRIRSAAGTVLQLAPDERLEVLDLLEQVTKREIGSD